MDPEKFDLLGPIRNIQTIASGNGVRIRAYLKRIYGGKNWRKLKGHALIKDRNNNVYEAEIHWFEAHSVGRVDWKIKRPIERR